MKRHSNGYLGLAIFAGASIGIGVGYLLYDDKLRHQIGRKLRRLSRACRYQSAELRDSANSLIEKGANNLKGAKETGRRVYHRLAG